MPLRMSLPPRTFRRSCMVKMKFSAMGRGTVLRRNPRASDEVWNDLAVRKQPDGRPPVTAAALWCTEGWCRGRHPT